MQCKSFGVNRDIPEETKTLLLFHELSRLVELELRAIWGDGKEEPLGWVEVKIYIPDFWEKESGTSFDRKIINVGAERKW